jgi:hypothetical protein
MSDRREPLVREPGHVPEPAGQGIVRHDPEPHLVRYDDDRPRKSANRSGEVIDLAFDNLLIRTPRDDVADPEREAVKQQDAVSAAELPYQLRNGKRLCSIRAVISASRACAVAR